MSEQSSVQNIDYSFEASRGQTVTSLAFLQHAEQLGVWRLFRVLKDRMRLFQQSLQTFKMAGAEKSKNFADLLHFMGHLAGGKTTDCGLIENGRKSVGSQMVKHTLKVDCMEIRALGGTSSET